MKILNLSNTCLIGALILGLLVAQRGVVMHELSAKHLTVSMAGCTYCSNDAMIRCDKEEPRGIPCIAKRLACIMDPNAGGICDKCKYPSQGCYPCFDVANCKNQRQEVCYGT